MLAGPGSLPFSQVPRPFPTIAQASQLTENLQRVHSDSTETIGCRCMCSAPCTRFLSPVASQGCHSRAPHSAWLEITESLAHRSQGQVFKSRWHQGWFLLEGPGGGRGCSLPLCQLLVAAGNPWHPWLLNASLPAQPPSSDPVFPVSGFLSPSYNDTGHMGSRAHPTLAWPHFNLITSTKTLLPIKVTFAGTKG